MVGGTSSLRQTEEFLHSVTLLSSTLVRALVGAGARPWPSLLMPAVGATGSSLPQETSMHSATPHISGPLDHRALRSLPWCAPPTDLAIGSSWPAGPCTPMATPLIGVTRWVQSGLPTQLRPSSPLQTAAGTGWSRLMASSTHTATLCTTEGCRAHTSTASSSRLLGTEALRSAVRTQLDCHTELPGISYSPLGSSMG